MLLKIKNLLFKTLLYLFAVLLIAGLTFYLQGDTAVQFLGFEKTYTVKPVVLIVGGLLLLIVLAWIKNLLGWMFVRLPGNISQRARTHLAQKRHDQMRKAISQLLRGEYDRAAKSIAKSVDDHDHSIDIQALAIQVLIKAQQSVAARELYNSLTITENDQQNFLLLNARLLQLENKNQAALAVLTEALSRYPDNEAICDEISQMIERQDLDDVVGELLTDDNHQKLPDRLLNNPTCKRLVAIKKLTHSHPDERDGFVAGLPREIAQHENFVLARIDLLQADNQIDECYRIAGEFLHHSWSDKLIHRLDKLPRPEDETVVAVYEKLVAQYPEHSHLLALYKYLKECFYAQTGRPLISEATSKVGQDAQNEEQATPSDSEPNSTSTTT